MTTLPFLFRIQDLPHFSLLDRRLQEELARVTDRYPFRLPWSYLRRMEAGNTADPLYLQAVPTGEELAGTGTEDPLAEGPAARTPILFKRYPHRAVFLVSSECAMYCRFCNRKRMAGKGLAPRKYFEETFRYLENDKELNEVILSGGDPLMIAPGMLDAVISRLREMAHIRTIRLSTRMPAVYPEGISGDHFDILKRHGPLWIVFHVNHPREVSPEFMTVARKFREAGGILLSQTVLLRGVNDCPHILARLFEQLVWNGIKPYYLFQLDEVAGAGHFKVQVETGIRIMRTLRTIASGLAVPHYVMDITGGLGKIPLESNFIAGREGDLLEVENTAGDRGLYRDDGKASACKKCGICGN